MLILLKQKIKTSFLILLFMTVEISMYAFNPSSLINEKTNHTRQEFRNELAQPGDSVTDVFISADSITAVQKDSVNVNPDGDENASMYALLVKTPIDFRINSAINYRKFNHFMREDAKEMFFQGWLKEVELQKITQQTENLRKAYAEASAEEREKISTLIIEAEQKSMTLYEEIPGFFQKAREIEARHWQSASTNEIMQFQQQVEQYEDSMIRSTQEVVQTEVHDTITLYTQAPVAEEQKAEVPGGIFYRIQIGSYKGKIPESSNRLIKKLSLIRKVENRMDEKGYKVYTTGSLRSHAEAVIMLGQVKQEGVKNAVITAYQNDKKIPITEAQKLNKEL